MANSVFRNLSNALLTRDDETPLVLPCANTYEFKLYMAIFIPAFMRYQTQSNPGAGSSKAVPDLDIKELGHGKYVQTIEDQVFYIHFDSVAHQLTIESKPYDKRHVGKMVEAMNYSLFYKPIKKADAYFIRPNSELEAYWMATVFQKLFEAHQIPGKVIPSALPFGLTLSQKQFEKLSKSEKIPNVGPDFSGVGG